ncbi:glycosyltransferase family 4 protein [Kaistella sp. PBT33-4]|uniref:glycosyltransferase family 4 protein n=1 Tax=Kaistella sp. PBT33-4 TaxID=3032000 RepID=UPI0023D8746F|nr:glycosyltransferase family 4 protein [Kaistella sp. PBT33-4]MDF0718785.1 glycosyltransferase family 4 protein [Kaistella sp. PBT33-4]
MKVIFLTKYTRKGASSRLRSYQYFPWLMANGFEVEVSPLFGDQYLENLYKGRKSITQILKAYISRFFKVLSLPKDSLVVIEYELFPYLPAWFETMLSKKGVKYIVDYDDAIFHNYDLSSNILVKKFLSDKINKVMQGSSFTVVGNAYLERKAKDAGATHVIRIPTVVDLQRYDVKSDFFTGMNQKLIVGWIGTFSTFKYLKTVIPFLEDLAKVYPIVLHVVGAKEELDTTLEIKFIPWTESSEAASIRAFDVGIMPLEDTPWERGKCGYKLIQYMASGIPVIASGVGANTEIVSHSVNGFIANSDQEWKNAFLYFLSKRHRLTEMGMEGRKMVVEKYCLQKTAAQWLETLKFKF